MWDDVLADLGMASDGIGYMDYNMAPPFFRPYLTTGVCEDDADRYFNWSKPIGWLPGYLRLSITHISGNNDHVTFHNYGDPRYTSRMGIEKPGSGTFRVSTSYVSGGAGNTSSSRTYAITVYPENSTYCSPILLPEYPYLRIAAEPSITEAQNYLYPNPTSGKVFLKNIDNTQKKEVRELRIFDTQGRVYKDIKFDLTDQSVNLRHLPPGLYRVVFSIGENQFSEMILKQ
jgi:hypothetical protein